jgi:hypothetical protein
MSMQARVVVEGNGLRLLHVIAAIPIPHQIFTLRKQAKVSFAEPPVQNTRGPSQILGDDGQGGSHVSLPCGE